MLAILFTVTFVHLRFKLSMFFHSMSLFSMLPATHNLQFMPECVLNCNINDTSVFEASEILRTFSCTNV